MFAKILIKYRLRLFFFLFPFLLILSGCNHTDFPKYYFLDRLRILALIVNTPEITNPTAGTTTVQLTPVVSDLNGSGDLQVQVQSCLDPGVALGAIADCTSALYASPVQTSTISSLTTFSESEFGDPERTGIPQSGAIAVPLTIPNQLLEKYNPISQYNGVSYLITVKVISATSSVSAFRRILLSTKTANLNPVVSDLKINNISISQRPTEGSFTLSFSTSDSPEAFLMLNSSGNFVNYTEEYQLTWFVSEGTLSSPRSSLGETTIWDLGAADPLASKKTVMVGVLRDGRGGQSFIEKKMGP